MGRLKTSLTGRIATRAPLDENRPAEKRSEQQQESVPAQTLQSRFFFEFLNATLLNAGFKQPLKAFADLHNTAVDH